MRCYICDEETNFFCDSCGKATCDNCIGQQLERGGLLFGEDKYACVNCARD